MPGSGAHLGASCCSAAGLQALWEAGVRGVWDSRTWIPVLLRREPGMQQIGPGMRPEERAPCPRGRRGPRGFVCLELAPPLPFPASFLLSFSGT